MKKVKIKLATETITTPDLPSAPIVAITGEAVEIAWLKSKKNDIKKMMVVEIIEPSINENNIRQWQDHCWRLKKRVKGWLFDIT